MIPRAAVFGLLGLLIASMAIPGCATVRPAPGQGAPQVTFTPPTPERPIVSAIGQPGGLLVFGGPDGNRRLLLKRPADLVGYGMSPDGRVAALLAESGAVSFYDPSGNVVGTIRLPGYLPPEATESQSATVYVGPRRQAVVALTRGPKGPRDEHELRPDYSPRKSQSTCYYVDMNESTARLNVGEILGAWFAADGRFAVVVGQDKAGPTNPQDAWRLVWFDRPDKPAWEVEFHDRPWLDGPKSGWDLAVRLPSRWPIYFRADGEHAAIRDDPALFNKWNPGYVERAGTHYEKEYLDKAVDDLVSKTHLNEKQRSAARKVLRLYIYDWLGSYTREGGEMHPKDFTVCVAALDERMTAVLTPGQLATFVAWRQQAANALGFLMRPPLDPAVPPEIHVRKL